MKSKPRPQLSDPLYSTCQTSSISTGSGRSEKSTLRSHAMPSNCLRRLRHEHGHDWKDWFRAESELHLNE
jgi:hypothetical protein